MCKMLKILSSRERISISLTGNTKKREEKTHSFYDFYGRFIRSIS